MMQSQTIKTHNPDDGYFAAIDPNDRMEVTYTYKHSGGLPCSAKIYFNNELVALFHFLTDIDGSSFRYYHRKTDRWYTGFLKNDRVDIDRNY